MIGRKLKELRQKKGCTIAQLCQDINMSPNTYAKYEREERDVSTETLEFFANFYGVSTDYLLGRDTGEPSPLDQLSTRFNMTMLEREIVDGYLKLPPEQREDMMEFLQKTVEKCMTESGK